MQRNFPLVFSTVVLFAALAAPIAAEPPPAHRDAATELLLVMRVDRDLAVGSKLMLDLQVQQNPDLAPYRDVVQEWAESVITWEAAGPRLVELYASRFTESELREMIAFYRTPTGQKVLAELPELVQQSAAIGVDLANERSGELDVMIRQRTRELEQAAPAPGAAGGAARPSLADREASKATLQLLRDAGTAMMSWLTDAMVEASGQAEEKAPGWPHCPPISHEELQSLLEPGYILELPRADGWGHPLEFCLDRVHLFGTSVVGVRSAGRDGVFHEGEPLGRFDPSDFDRDIVWLDGLFVSWPQTP